MADRSVLSILALLTSYLILVRFDPSAAQSSCDDEEESGFKTTVESISDSSGVYNLSAPPTLVGNAIYFQCPGIKEYKGENSWRFLCKEGGVFAFEEDLSQWPECQCSTDMSKMACSGVNYTTVYQDGGNQAGAILELTLPEDTTDFHVDISMDSAVIGMSPETGSNANLLVTGDRHIIIQPTGSADLTAATIRIDIDYDMKTTGWVPRYRLPCPTQIDCKLDSADEGWSRKALWAFLAAVAAVVIVLMCFCFFVCYCMKEYGNKPVEPATEANSPVPPTTLDYDF